MKAALYGQYSTDKQSESSIDDQLRECRKLAESHGFDVVSTFSDKALSGGTTKRPGYQQMFTDARAGRFGCIVAEDCSRLWRNMAEQAPRLAELADLGIHVVTHDLDTRQESASMLGAVLGASGEAYRREIGRRTRRGLEGLARQKKPTGGRSYGYTNTDGERQIVPAEAAVIRRIFQMYADGMSPRAIAEQLNVERIPSPGSSWNRTNRRKTGWAQSCIAGDAKRGTGILNNRLYAGDVIWNRFKWIRSGTDSSKRRRVQNPELQWIIHRDESLRIVDQPLWNRVSARQRGRSEDIGARVRSGLSKSSAKSTGRNPRYLFSSLLKCGACGSSYTIRGRSHYACARHLDGRACTQTIGVKRAVVEPGLLQGIKSELLSDDAVDIAAKAAHRLLNQQKPSDTAKRQKALRREIDNFVNAIAAGTFSPSLAERLSGPERELAELEADRSKPAKVLPGIADAYRAMVNELETVLSPAGLERGTVSDNDIARARAQLKGYLGDIVVMETESEIRFQTETSAEEMALRMAGSGSQVFMVAGARFANYRRRVVLR
jgi:DNA invertase Pin-like site-specific DNA recombinase